MYRKTDVKHQLVQWKNKHSIFSKFETIKYLQIGTKKYAMMSRIEVKLAITRLVNRIA